ncbi:MAG: hypothetical protein R8G66_13640 [Cytophagales bacterium]|nr:hypothetical protein [Cytophagales bacterium]
MKNRDLTSIQIIIYTWLFVVLFGNSEPNEKILLTLVALGIALVLRIADGKLGKTS